MSVVDQHVAQGDRVTLDQRRSLERQNRWNERREFEPGHEFTVTRVYNDTLIVREMSLERSYSVYRSHVSLVGGGGRRRLGQKPDDTADMTYIGVDHPGIQWLWDDFGEYAQGQEWCRQYDRLVESFGIPGRKQPFHVVRTVHGISFTTTVRARSQTEAESMVDHALADPEPTPIPGDVQSASN